jgi:hypothetical protein
MQELTVINNKVLTLVFMWSSKKSKVCRTDFSLVLY